MKSGQPHDPVPSRWRLEGETRGNGQGVPTSRPLSVVVETRAAAPNVRTYGARHCSARGGREEGRPMVWVVVEHALEGVARWPCR